MDDRLSPSHRAPLDDAALAILVRDVAGEWSLPPQRLGTIPWRDRVGRGHHASDRRTGWRWTGRLIGAAGVAVVATVSFSVAVVWMTAQRGDNGTSGPSASPGVSSSPSPSGSAVPTASAMPKLVRNGDLPTPSRIMVQTGQGYHLVDLATGDLGPVLIDAGHGPTAVLARPGGGWVCICGDGQNAIRLSAETIDANGVVGAPRPIKDVVGTGDPRASRDLQPMNAAVRVSASPDGRLALIGWVRRDGEAGWRIGADVFDLDTLATVASTELLLDEPVERDGRPLVRQAPLVRLSPAGDWVMLASTGHDDMSGQGSHSFDHWLAPFDGRSIGVVASAGATTNHDCFELDSGLIDVGPASDDAVYYTLCASPDRPFTVDRFAADGRLVSATELPGNLAGIADGLLAPPSGEVLFSRDPFESVLSRLDLRNGELSVGEPQRPNAKGLTGPSAGLIVASVDGTRLYTLGIGTVDGRGDSSGVFAFDAANLTPLGHWAAQAHLTSIAVSEDGRYVCAAADGGVTSSGDPGPEFGASITTYDTSDGSVALLAGRLGARDLTLGETICR